MQIVRSKWGTNPFTRGSYSYVSARATNEDVDTLGASLMVKRGGRPVPVVCFAGEATSRKHIGTTSGAFLSGLREANRLIDALGIGRSGQQCHTELITS